MNNILITDCVIIPMTEAGEKKYFTGSIGIENDKIAFVGEGIDAVRGFREKHRGDLKEIEGRGKLAMPGLINTHNHISMTLLRGYADDLPLMRWLNEYIWPFEAKMTRDDVMLGAELGMAEMLLGGTTTSADMYWMDEAVAEAAEKSGIRAVIGSSVLDQRIADFDKDFGMLTKKYAPGMHSTITLMAAPHSVYTCSESTLMHAKEAADKYGVGIMIHISETLDEQRMVRERYNKTPIELLRDLGMLTPKTLIVHAVHVNDSDIDIMAQHGVSVAYNPQSNMKLASGIAPVTKMTGGGINVALGTDGPSSNNDLDMWEEMRAGSFLQKVATSDPCVIPAYEMLKMATVNGAKALGLENTTGMLKSGMAADIILLDLEKPHLYPQTDMVANIAYCAKSSDVSMVIVNGQILVEKCRLLRTDTAWLNKEVQKRFKDIRQR